MKDKNIELAATFAAQSDPVPVFLKREINCWGYVGDFVVDRYVTDPTEVEPYQATVNREITGILLLK